MIPTQELAAHIGGTIARIANIPRPAPDVDVYLAGFASTDALELLVELEEQFQVSIPDDRFIEARSCAAFAQLVQSLSQAVP